jgi:hypothetical protein
MDGTPLDLGVSADGGACGEWTDANSAPAITLSGRQTVTRKHE